MKKGTRMAIAVFAAVFLWLAASPFIYGNNGQPSSGNESPAQPPFPKLTPDGLYIPAATISALLAVVGLAAKLG
jgi:hypothetical protein